MITMEGSTKIVIFMTPGAEVLALGRKHISYIVNMDYSLKFFFSSSRHRTDKVSI